MLSKIAKYKNLLPVVLVVLLILVVSLLLSSRNPSSKTPSQPEATASGIPEINYPSQQTEPQTQYQPFAEGPTLSTKPTKSITAELEAKKKEFIKKLPLYLESFNVEYFSSEELFLITISQNPLEENKKKAAEWLKSQGFSNDDLERIKIGFTHPRFVQ